MSELDRTVHKPVLLQEVMDGMAFERHEPSERRPILLDCTLGGAGHSEALLLKYSNLFLVGLDRDPRAIRRAEERLRPFSDRMLLFVDNFANIHSLLSTIEEGYAAKAGPRKTSGTFSFDRILLDLGISSDQLDDPERGFSFARSGPLDMRMSAEQELMAADIVNEYPIDELKRIFLRGGVGPDSARLARAIERGRPYETTTDLANVIAQVLRERPRKKKGEEGAQKHPATVPFQAIRIAVNDELTAIDQFLSDAIELLFPKGRLGVISFHSLEDQLVARRMREWARGPVTPLRLPVPEGVRGFGRLLTGKAIRASADEVRDNPRSRSARLRVFEKWEDGAAGPQRREDDGKGRRQVG